MLLNKPEMAAEMVVYALASGFSAEHLLADAWFGNKTTLRLTQATDLTAIVRMKKEKTQYRYSYYRYGVRCTTLADAKDSCTVIMFASSGKAFWKHVTTLSCWILSLIWPRLP